MSRRVGIVLEWHGRARRGYDSVVANKIDRSPNLLAVLVHQQDGIELVSAEHEVST